MDLVEPELLDELLLRKGVSLSRLSEDLGGSSEVAARKVSLFLAMQKKRVFFFFRTRSRGSQEMNPSREKSNPLRHPNLQLSYILKRENEPMLNIIEYYVHLLHYMFYHIPCCGSKRKSD